MKNPIVTIIIPLYNGEKYIQRLIDTIWQQTYQTFEVIFINDGSKDQTAKVLIEKLEEKQYQNYVLVDNVLNQGISKSKNEAIKIATGDYIMFLDQDDYLSASALELLIARVKNGCDYVVGNYIREYDYKKRFYEKMFEFQPSMNSVEGASLLENPDLLITIHQALWAKLYKKELFDDFQFDESLHGVEDLGSTSILLAKSKKIGVVSDVIYHYIYSKSSTINEANSSYVVTDTYNAFNNFYDYYQKEGLDELYREELEYLYVYHCVLSVSVRTFQRTRNYQELIEKVYTDLNKRFPEYKKNKYYKTHLKISKYFIFVNKYKLGQFICSRVLGRKRAI